MEQLEQGKVIGSEGGRYEVMTQAGASLFCPARGVFRHEGLKVLVGDEVTVRKEENPDAVSIFEVHPRKNELIRPPMANLELLFTVFAVGKPTPLPENTDKILAVAEENNIRPAVVITKSDLDREAAERYAALYRQCGFPTFTVGEGDEAGLASLRTYLMQEAGDKISAFAGASGVGKSTLLTRLFPHLKLETGDLSRKIQRGRQTTRQVKLFPLRQLMPAGDSLTGFVADTPGFGTLDFTAFDFFDTEALPFNFREFVPYLGKCRYTKCTHRREEGCAIREAVAAGVIPLSRHESYCSIYESIKRKGQYKEPAGSTKARH